CARRNYYGSYWYFDVW
nr:immunoglobulin heavy chain junction region [Mus musculus]